MREPAIIARLVKPDGRIILAREKTAMEEMAKLQAQMDKLKQDAMDELQGDLREAKKKVAEIMAAIAEFTGRKAKGTRAAKRCSICVKAGKPGIGHTARTHKKFMAEQKD